MAARVEEYRRYIGGRLDSLRVSLTGLAHDIVGVEPASPTPKGILASVLYRLADAVEPLDHGVAVDVRRAAGSIASMVAATSCVIGAALLAAEAVRSAAWKWRARGLRLGEVEELLSMLTGALPLYYEVAIGVLRRVARSPEEELLLAVAHSVSPNWLTALLASALGIVEVVDRLAFLLAAADMLGPEERAGVYVLRRSHLAKLALRLIGGSA